MGKTPFLGTAYMARSSNLNAQRLVNLYLETVETKDGSAPGAFFSCPSLDLAMTFPTTPVRATRVVAGILYAVAGNAVYSVVGLTPTVIGTIGTSTGAAYIVSNGTQVGFFDGLGLSVLTIATSVFASVTLPYDGPVGVPAQQDTLCLLSQPGTYNIWQSGINDLTSWPPLTFTTEDGNNENIVALIAFHDQVVVMKEYSTCFYVNEGNANFAYGRLSGLYPETGCAVPFSAVVINDAIYWVGQTRGGQIRLYAMKGYEPEEISTYAIENTINGYSTISDVVVFGYVQEGHPFAIFQFPTAGQTWVFDLKETKRLGAQCWHERAGFSGGQFTLYDGSCCVQMGAQIYMGSYFSGNLYLLNLYTALGPLDNGSPRKILRSWQQDKQANYAAEKCNFLDLQMDTGIGVPETGNPQLVLRQSFDGGQSWSAEQYQAAGVTGASDATVRFRRLGATRRGLNSFRIFELSSTDQFQAAFFAAETE